MRHNNMPRRFMRCAAFALLGASIGAHAQFDLGPNIALNSGADGSSKGSTSYGSVYDGNLGTYWQPSSSNGERISVKGFSGEFNTVIIRELNNATTAWRLVDHRTGVVLAAGTSLGEERVITGFGASSGKVNLMIDSATAAPQIAEFEVYNATGTPPASSSSEAASSVPAPASSSAPEASSSSAASSSPAPDVSIRPAQIEGFAAYTNVTGGAGGPVHVVTTGTELNQALCGERRNNRSAPVVILVNGTINHGNTTSQGCDTQNNVIEVKNTSNVSIIGIGENALFDEIGIHVRAASNIIIQNVHIRNVKKSGSPTSNGGDAIGMESNVDRVWIDHNWLEASGGEKDGYDSLLDMKAGVTNVTVSYNLFNDSSRGGLIGSSDGDNRNNNITFHHNWYKNIEQRTPLIRHATVHMYNNYWSNENREAMIHGINSRMHAHTLVESNYFYNTNNPLLASSDSNQSGCWQTNNDNTLVDHIYSRSVGNGALVVPEIINGQMQSTCNVSVPYTVDNMDAAADVPAIVMANAGVGRITVDYDGNVGVGSSSSQSSSSVASSSLASSSIAASSSSAVSSESASSEGGSQGPAELGANLALTGPGAGADGSGFSNTKNVRDGDTGTASQARGTSDQRIAVKWSNNQVFNTVILREQGNNITSWELSDHASGAIYATGTTVGAEQVVYLGPVSSKKINLWVRSASSPPALAEFEIYNATGEVGGGASSSEGGTSSAGNNSSSGQTSSTGGQASSSGGQTSSTGGANSSSGSQSSNPGANPGYSGPITNDCITLATDPSVNWRDMPSLQSDQEIVECLSQTLGRPIGYGENALGGYDPNGNSKLTVITTSDARSVEEQVRDAIADDDHNWIVFDKFDFADEYEISFHRMWCSDANMLNALGGTTAECLEYRTWCSNRGINDHGACMEEFFNKRLHNSSLNNVRNPIVGSNTTIDGRMNNAYIRFMGFRIGNDSGGVPTQTSSSVIITHIDFRGAGHTEDHRIDPDMIRNTGASHDIWIHKNSFDLTGDSAFDVKVGAYNITMSFNEVIDVKRAALHGSSDSRVINENITTTMHHNAFITRDENYRDFGNTARRVPLIRRGTSHMFNNVFVNYRKDILSIRVGAQVLWENNMMVVNRIHQEKSSLDSSLNELQNNLVRDVNGGSFRAEDVGLWFFDGVCELDETTRREITRASGTVPNLANNYSQHSYDVRLDNHLDAGQQLLDYVSATAGKFGEMPFNSPLAGDPYYVLGLGKVSCLR